MTARICGHCRLPYYEETNYGTWGCWVHMQDMVSHDGPRRYPCCGLNLDLLLVRGIQLGTAALGCRRADHDLVVPGSTTLDATKPRIAIVQHYKIPATIPAPEFSSDAIIVAKITRVAQFAQTLHEHGVATPREELLVVAEGLKRKALVDPAFFTYSIGKIKEKEFMARFRRDIATELAALLPLIQETIALGGRSLTATLGLATHPASDATDHQIIACLHELQRYEKIQKALADTLVVVAPINFPLSTLVRRYATETDPSIA